MDAKELLDRFLAGDASAWKALADVASRAVRFDGYYIPAQERPELVQEVLQHVWAQASEPGFEIRKDLKALTRRIALCRCVEWVRRSRRRPASVALDPSSSVFTSPGTQERHVVNSERLVLGEKILARLHPSYLKLIRMVVVERKKYPKEIAEIEGKSVDAVRRQWCDCLQACRAARKEIEASLAAPKVIQR